jgi:hypothetical protein
MGAFVRLERLARAAGDDKAREAAQLGRLGCSALLEAQRVFVALLEMRGQQHFQQRRLQGYLERR